MHEQYFAGAAMQDVEDWASELGFPSEGQMWRQHSRLIEAELCIVQSELSKARRDITRLVDMHQTAVDELAKLRKAHEALQRQKNAIYVDFVSLSNRINFTPSEATHKAIT